MGVDRQSQEEGWGQLSDGSSSRAGLLKRGQLGHVGGQRAGDIIRKVACRGSARAEPGYMHGRELSAGAL